MVYCMRSNTHKDVGILILIILFLLLGIAKYQVHPGVPRYSPEGQLGWVRVSFISCWTSVFIPQREAPALSVFRRQSPTWQAEGADLLFPQQLPSSLLYVPASPHSPLSTPSVPALFSSHFLGRGFCFPQ